MGNSKLFILAKIRSIITAVLSVCCFFGCKLEPKVTADGKISSKLINADFDKITKMIEQETPNAFYLCSKSSYDSLKAIIKVELNTSLSPIEFYKKVEPLISLLNDGHFQLFLGDSVVNSLENDNPFLYFPITVFVNGNRLYANVNLSFDPRIDKGMEILSINHIPSSTIIKIMRHNRNLSPSQENFFERRLENHFWRSLLFEIGLRNDFAIAFENTVVNLKGVSGTVIRRSNDNTSDFNHRIILGKTKIGYLRVNTLVYEKKSQLDSASAEFFKQLADQHIDNLIIDIRNNLGGSSKLARNVFDYITTKDYKIDIGEQYLVNGKKVTEWDTTSTSPRFKDYKYGGRTILLTNVTTYSSAHMMAVSFQKAGMGKVIGQVSSEPLFISGEVKKLVLDNTKCKFYFPVSNFYLPGYSKNHVSYFTPDIVSYPTISDKVNGRDKAIQLAVGIFK
jgi:hypothetical protein